jgi:hypothetical protein
MRLKHQQASRAGGAPPPRFRPLSPRRRSWRRPRAARDPVLTLIAQSEQRFEAGQKALADGHVEAARLEFDKAIGMLLESHAADVRSRGSARTSIGSSTASAHMK